MQTAVLILALLTGSNPVLFASADSRQWTLEGWEAHAQRDALLPLMNKNSRDGRLVSQSNGEFRINGAWRKPFPVTAGKFYRVYAEYLIRDIELPRRSVLVKIDWRGEDGKKVTHPDYPAGISRIDDQRDSVEGVFKAPDEATEADVQLIFRWSRTGEVEWQQVSFERAPEPPAREVKVATINFRPRNSAGPRENLKKFAPYLKQAGEQGADIVLMPEGVTLVGTGLSYTDVAEPMPGASSNFLGKLAAKYSMYIVAGLLERDGETVYNTAVLIDRKGNLAGTYRKVSLPREEIEGGITAGESFPVFETDFGKIGMMICWDVQFPEPARRLSLQGAEMILMPIWGGVESLFGARAIENQIYLVSSSYDVRTGIWDPEGKLLSEAAQNGSVAFTTVDLSKPTYWPWLGALRDRLAREAPPAREP